MTATSARIRGWAVAAVVLLVAVVGPLSALSAEAAGAVTWKAAVGYSSSDQAIQSNFYFPNNITIDKGDSITWNLKSGEFHTVSFLSPGMTPPSFVTIGPNGPELNPVALAPSGPSSYNGTDFVNSGLLAGPGQSFTLKFDSVGTYQYNCLVHTPMKGWVKVQPVGAPYPHSQTYYNAQATAAETASIGQGYVLEAVGLAKALSAGVGHVTAGIGQFFSAGSIGIVRFLPQVDVIHQGQTVTWNNRDPEFPHTVTFNFQALDAQGNPFLFFPQLGSTTMTTTGQDLNSGFLVAGLQTQFTAKFDAPGVYQYRCVLHDDLGMTGSVVVLPGS